MSNQGLAPLAIDCRPLRGEEPAALSSIDSASTLRIQPKQCDFFAWRLAAAGGFVTISTGRFDPLGLIFWRL
jgi:hypothetical protein